MVDKKEVLKMRGGRGIGRGMFMGYAPGFGMPMWGGRGNPYPFCRFYPWLPRRWWAYGAYPYAYVPRAPYIAPYSAPMAAPYTPPVW